MKLMMHTRQTTQDPRGASRGLLPPGRRGVTLTELIVTMLLLGSAMAAVVPVVKWGSTQRQVARQREFALQEAAGVLEDLTAREWDEITPELAERVAPSESARAVLRDPEWTVTVDDASDAAPPGKRIVVELRWKDHAGHPAAPARLTTWVFRRESEEAE